MYAMILAAGRGERMRPLTDNTPKPLLELKGKPLIVHQIEALRYAGYRDLVINLGYLGGLIRKYLSNGESLGVQITYSDEGDHPLETAGGIVKALPLLGEQPFLVTNADIFTDFNYRLLPAALSDDAHLVMVDNPAHNADGDFSLIKGRIRNEGSPRLTYSGIGLFHPRFFRNCPRGRYPLAPLLRVSADNDRLGGQHFTGCWSDIGTPERLEEIDSK